MTTLLLPEQRCHHDKGIDLYPLYTHGDVQSVLVLNVTQDVDLLLSN